VPLSRSVVPARANVAVAGARPGRYDSAAPAASARRANAAIRASSAGDAAAIGGCRIRDSYSGYCPCPDAGD